MKVNPDKREQYLELVSPLIEAANKEEGSLYYEHFEKTDEPNTYLLLRLRDLLILNIVRVCLGSLS